MGTRRQGLERMAKLRALSDAAVVDRLAAAGNSAKVLADQIGVNHLSVWKFLKARGIRWTPDNRRAMLDGVSRAAMYRIYIENGRNVSRMAAALGTCGATLRKRMRALGFRPRSSSRGALKQAVIPPTKAMLALLANVERRPTSQIGSILGVSRAMVSLYMRRFGLPTLTTQEGIARYLEWRHRVVDIEAERRRLTTLFVDATVVEALETSPHLRHED